jgi:RNA-binding protein YlmH
METELLIAKIKDTADICFKTEKPKFLGFLSAEQAVLAQKNLEKTNVKFSLFGGFESAERVMLGCFPDWQTAEEFPIKAITFTFRKTDKLSHRDFLGSILGLGLKREAIGDILIEEGRAIVFCLEEIADFILNQLTKVGRTGVKLKEGFTEPLPLRDNLLEFRDTIASNRLDCVVASLCKTSRSLAFVKINEGLVSLNSVPCEKPTKSVFDGDIIAVRGYGKFIIESVSGITKKQRIILKYKKYV